MLRTNVPLLGARDVDQQQDVSATNVNDSHVAIFNFERRRIAWKMTNMKFVAANLDLQWVRAIWPG